MKNPQRIRAHSTTSRASRNTQPKPGAAPSPALRTAIQEAIGFLDLITERLMTSLGDNKEHALAVGVYNLGDGLKARLRGQLTRLDLLELERLAGEAGALAMLILASLLASCAGEEAATGQGIASLAARVQQTLDAEVASLFAAGKGGAR